MANYSTNLALTLLATGEGAGTWGNTTNTNLGTLLEQAISGYVTQAVATGTDTTITIPNGATGVARNMYIELTGTGGTNTNLIVPTNKKLYFIFNNSTGAVTVKVTGQTGVTILAGEKIILACNGTDVVNAVSYISGGSASITTLTVASANITTLTGTSMNVTTATHASANITTLTGTSANITTITGTNAALTSLTLTNALRVAEGGTGLDSTPTNGQLLIGNGSGFSLSTLTAGTGVSITNNSGSITITAAGSGFITSVTASSPLASSGGATPDISIASSTGSGAVVLASGASFSATSANITTLTGTSANITTVTGTTGGFTSANITTLNSTSGTVTTLGSTSANITTLTGTSATITNILDGVGNVRNIPSAGTAKTSTYTLAITDIGEYVTVGSGGAIDVPNGVFSAGNAVSLYNDTTGNVTVSMTITTAYISGANTDKASVTLATRGLATILFLSNSVCVISGNVS